MKLIKYKKDKLYIKNYQKIFFYAINVHFNISFFSKKTMNTYLKLEIGVVCREYLGFKYTFIIYVFFLNKLDDYLYLYVRYLENSRLNPVFQYTISICICVSRQRILNRYRADEKQVLNVRIYDLQTQFLTNLHFCHIYNHIKS